MARKAKKRSARRSATGAPPARPVAPPPAAATAQGRPVQMSLSPRARRPPRGPAARLVLDSGDPAIPLDRVPYFLSDLRRLGLTAAAMVVLMVLGAKFLVPLIVR